MAKNIVFMGTPEFSVPILRSINEKYKLTSVFTQPPRKSKRGYKVNKTPVHILAENLGIPLKTPYKIENEFDYIKGLDLDLVIVVAYGQIIPKKILDLSKKGFINIHASLLPKWRGAAPIQRSILSMDKVTGISIMKINQKLDEGPVCNSYPINILENENAKSLTNRLANLSAEKILDNIKNIFEDKIKFVEQDHTKATYAKKLKTHEGKINWNENPLKIIAKINGLYPKPSAFFIFNGERYKVLKAKINNGFGKIGEVISNDLEVACMGEKSIKILEIQREGKKAQKMSEFVLGSQIKKGSIINND